MKPKNGKTGRLYQPSNIILESQMEIPAPQRSSWLKSALGLDEETQVRQKLALAAEIFLQTALFPLIDRAEHIDEETLIELLIIFKRLHTELNTEFEMSQVTARLLHRFQCRLMDEGEPFLPPIADPPDRDVLCLTTLARLDFQRIDEAVQDQYLSG